MKNVVLKIDFYRLKNNLSKTKLAQKTGMQMSRVAQMCNNTNKVDPTFATLKKFSEALNTPIKDLFDEMP